jgi:hypothetical protein
MDTKGLLDLTQGHILYPMDRIGTCQRCSAFRTPSAGEALMAKCEVCGNEYDLSFEVITAGYRHVFDCFECAIHKLAPICSHCGCKVIGHGISGNNTFYCCAHCAREAGVTGVADRG